MIRREDVNLWSDWTQAELARVQVRVTSAQLTNPIVRWCECWHVGLRKFWKWTHTAPVDVVTR